MSTLRQLLPSRLRGAPKTKPRCYFFSLSIELRLIIYEYVVWESYPIFPRQVAERSNKFYCPSRYRRTLTNTQLLYTCRQIYADLTAIPVFYKINTFEFQKVTHLHCFLAALTPQRRHMIRNIHIAARGFPKSCEWAQLGSKIRRPRYRQMFTLLHDCRDLRVLVLRIHISNNDLVDLCGFLSSMATISSTHKSSERYSLWNMPGFKISLEYARHFVVRFGEHEDTPDCLKTYGDIPSMWQ